MNVSRKISNKVSWITSRDEPGIYEGFIESSLGKCPGRIMSLKLSLKNLL